MTRINVNYPVEKLITRHLLSEHREIKRIPNNISKGKFNLKNIPEEFTLGKGHVKFFYDKLGYLKKRYEEVYAECKRRNYNVVYYGKSWDGVPKHLMNDYTPTIRDSALIECRINEKLNKVK